VSANKATRAWLRDDGRGRRRPARSGASLVRVVRNRGHADGLRESVDCHDLDNQALHCADDNGERLSEGAALFHFLLRTRQVDVRNNKIEADAFSDGIPRRYRRYVEAA